MLIKKNKLLINIEDSMVTETNVEKEFTQIRDSINFIKSEL